MTSLVTASILALAVFGALACDSNPTPHPDHPDVRDTQQPGSFQGDVNGSETGGRGESPDDLDPSGTDNEASEPCPSDAAAGSPDAADAEDEVDEVDGVDEDDDDAADGDDNETRDAAAAGPDATDSDCGPTEGAAPTAGASDDYDYVE